MDRMKTRRAEQAEGTRGALVDAARTLFAERGYASVGTEEIVAAARVTRGALYYHFEDKRDLFRTVFAEVDTELVQGIAQVALEQADPWQQLVAGCDAFLDSCVDPAIQRIVFLDAPSVLGWREWHEAGEAASALGVVEVGLNAANEAGILGIDNVPVFAHLVLGALNEAGMFIAHADDTRRARREVGDSMLQLLDGLRAQR
jgi:AcrR family transcriptional regulator